MKKQKSAAEQTVPDVLDDNQTLEKSRTASPSRFTIIELLVVIAIITIIAGMLMPALSLARKKANQISCISNMHQLGNAVTAYLSDSKEFFFPDKYGTCGANGNWRCMWMQLVSGYMGLDLGMGQKDQYVMKQKNTAFTCPAQRDGRGNLETAISYGYISRAFIQNEPYDSNVRLKLTRFKSPTKQGILVESYEPDSTKPIAVQRSTGYYLYGWGTANYCFRHLQSATMLYLDGHVQIHRYNYLYYASDRGYPLNMLGTNAEYYIDSARTYTTGFAPY